MMFRNEFATTIFSQKYAHEGAETWPKLCRALVDAVCGDLMPADDKDQLVQYMTEFKWLAGGRYLANANKEWKAYNNCFLLAATEDTREDWANLSRWSELCLTMGGGIGIDFSRYRPKGSLLKRSGGVASGAVSKALMINEIGRQVRQGGDRRSAMYGSLNWKHGDIDDFLAAKNWHDMPIAGTGKTIADVKAEDFNFPAPLDMMNVSVNYDTEWVQEYYKTGEPGRVFRKNVEQALRTSEPGFSFNMFEHEGETLRNACTEVVSHIDTPHDVCNLASLNFSRIENLQELEDVTRLVTKFLLCGTLASALPYEECYRTRELNRRLGLGIMGLHEWLLARGYNYEVNDELHSWLDVYETASDAEATAFSKTLGVSRPKGVRAIAPTGSIGILAGTTTGIEPLFAVAYKRRWLGPDNQWQYQYVVDSAAQEVIDRYGVDPDKIESALDLAAEPERRLKFQADVQKYVDQSISSTVNLPAWGHELNNEDTLDDYVDLVARYADKLRGLTFYADGSRGGQPLTAVPYSEASNQQGITFIETHDVCEIGGKGGVCGA